MRDHRHQTNNTQPTPEPAPNALTSMSRLVCEASIVQYLQWQHTAAHINEA